MRIGCTCGRAVKEGQAKTSLNLGAGLRGQEDMRVMHPARLVRLHFLLLHAHIGRPYHLKAFCGISLRPPLPGHATYAEDPGWPGKFWDAMLTPKYQNSTRLLISCMGALRHIA